MKEEKGDIYNLDVHQCTTVNGWDVIRVPGGWLYTRIRNVVFVPFNEEFRWTSTGDEKEEK